MKYTTSEKIGRLLKSVKMNSKRLRRTEEKLLKARQEGRREEERLSKRKLQVEEQVMRARLDLGSDDFETIIFSEIKKRCKKLEGDIVLFLKS